MQENIHLEIMKNNGKMESVIFDMDGVLVDSEEYHYLSHKKALSEYGVHIDKDFYIKNGVSIENEIFYKKAFNDNNLSLNIIKEIKLKKLKYFQNFQHKDGIKPIDESIKLVEKLYQAGVVIAVCSAVDREYLHHTLNELGIYKLFNVTVAGNDYPINNKPAPDIYVKTSELLGIAQGKCIAIEDSSNGALAAIRAEMVCLVVQNEYTKLQKITQKAHIMSSFLEVGNLIEKLV